MSTGHLDVPFTSNGVAASASVVNSRVLLQSWASHRPRSTELLYQTITNNEIFYTLSSNKNFSSPHLGKISDGFSPLAACMAPSSPMKSSQ